MQNIQCTLPRDDLIRISNIFFSTVPAGTEITFAMTNMVLDIDRRMKTEPWVLTTYTGDGYQIDRNSEDLFFFFPCNPPCQTCDPSDPNKCNSCNFLTDSTILYENRCYSSCPNGLYNMNGECVSCDEKCKTCSDDNPRLCLSCERNSEYPFL